jgi:hypothetical protein
MKRTFLVTTDIDDSTDPNLIADEITNILSNELDDPYLTTRPWSSHGEADIPTTSPTTFPLL